MRLHDDDDDEYREVVDLEWVKKKPAGCQREIGKRVGSGNFPD